MLPLSTPSRKTLLISNIVFCLIILVIIIYPKIGNVSTVAVSRDYSAEYKFTNPILDYENVKMESVSILSESVEHKVNDLQNQYGIGTASVYYRDLDNGQWIGVNEKKKFASASLIKLPVLIAILKEAEDNPAFLEKKISVTEADIALYSEQNILPDNLMKTGNSYTVGELSERMIEQSDNAAWNMLVRDVDEKYRKEVFQSIGVAYQEINNDIMVDVKDYAGFFRVLFNATYLNRTDSEKALNILSQSTFDKGIVAGVPKGTVVAHKFGERTNYINSILVNRQLHDCGIIYHPEKPYILCVMTRGNDYTSEEAFIKDISQFFYKEVDKSLGHGRLFPL
jgi:beta-lactamase class A